MSTENYPSQQPAEMTDAPASLAERSPLPTGPCTLLHPGSYRQRELTGAALYQHSLQSMQSTVRSARYGTRTPTYIHTYAQTIIIKTHFLETCSLAGLEFDIQTI